jgi:hypothetical protein
MNCYKKQHVWSKINNTEYFLHHKDANYVFLVDSTGREIKMGIDDVTFESPFANFAKASTLENRFVWAKKTSDEDSNEYDYGYLMKGSFLSFKTRTIDPDELVSLSPVYTMGVVADYIWSVSRDRLMIVQLDPNPWERCVISTLCPMDKVSVHAIRLLHPHLPRALLGFIMQKRKS